MNGETVIADASCLIVLENIGHLPVLQQLFGEIYITQEVQSEFGGDLPEWIKIRIVQNTIQQNALALILDAGEVASIALSLETDNSLLIIDERKGRRVAQQLNLKIIGYARRNSPGKRKRFDRFDCRFINEVGGSGFQNLAKLAGEDFGKRLRH